MACTCHADPKQRMSGEHAVTQALCGGSPTTSFVSLHIMCRALHTAPVVWKGTQANRVPLQAASTNHGRVLMFQAHGMAWCPHRRENLPSTSSRRRPWNPQKHVPRGRKNKPKMCSFFDLEMGPKVDSPYSANTPLGPKTGSNKKLFGPPPQRPCAGDRRHRLVAVFRSKNSESRRSCAAMQPGRDVSLHQPPRATRSHHGAESPSRRPFER